MHQGISYEAGEDYMNPYLRFYDESPEGNEVYEAIDEVMKQVYSTCGLAEIFYWCDKILEIARREGEW